MDPLEHSRYKNTPVYIFFENYILDVTGNLSADKHDILQQLDLQSVFGTQAFRWKDVIREALKLSSTIDLTILHEWYKSIETAESQNQEIDPGEFCKDFVDRYFNEESTLDAWNEDTLMEAKELIRKHQMLEKTT